MKVSPEWTDKERLAIVALIAARIEQAARMPANPRMFFDLANTIRMISTKPAGFLEANRKQVLDDAGITE